MNGEAMRSPDLYSGPSGKILDKFRPQEKLPTELQFFQSLGTVIALRTHRSF
jgi:hypothetical protein